MRVPIAAVEATNGIRNGELTYRVTATFTDERGRVRVVEGFTEDRVSRGHVVEIGYDLDDRDAPRIRGFRSGRLPRASWLCLLAPLVGGGIAMSRVRHGRRVIALLRVGVPTTGRLVERDGKTLTFEYEARGRHHRCKVTTSDADLLLDQGDERMVFDPRRPDRATTLDHLPGAPRVAADGTLAYDAGVVEFLILPAMTIVFTALAVVLHYAL